MKRSLSGIQQGSGVAQRTTAGEQEQERTEDSVTVSRGGTMLISVSCV